MSEAFERFADMLQLADTMLESASRQNVAECCRILALNVAHYRSVYGELPMKESLELLSTPTVDDDQAKWLGDGMEQIVAVLRVLEAQGSEH